MWPIAFEVIRQAGAVLLCGIAVKLMDDYLDQELDYHTGRQNWAYYWGKSTLVYAMVAIVLAAALYYILAVALFLASYVVGMGHELRQALPSRLSGWQESLLALCLGAVLCGWRAMLFAICYIGAVQIIDDCLDHYVDTLVGRSGKRNIARLLGPVEAVLLAILLLLVAWHLIPQYFIAAVLGTAALVALMAYGNAKFPINLN